MRAADAANSPVIMQGSAGGARKYTGEAFEFKISGIRGHVVICQARYESFGSAGHASKIKVAPLDQMVCRNNALLGLSGTRAPYVSVTCLEWPHGHFSNS